MLSAFQRTEHLVCHPTTYGWIFTLIVLWTLGLLACVLCLSWQFRRLLREHALHHQLKLKRRLLQVATATVLLVAYLLWGDRLERNFVVAKERLSDPPWKDSSQATAHLGPLLQKASQEVMRLLGHHCTSEELLCWQGAVDRLPNMVELKSRPTDEQRKELERHDAHLGMLAEVHLGGGDRPIVLYADQIVQGWKDLTEEARITSLGYILLHELAHVASPAGGILNSPVRGDRILRGRLTPAPDHLGLHAWLAELARLDFERASQDSTLSEEEREARQVAACQQMRRTGDLFRPGAVYGAAVERNANEDPFGPPTWGLRREVEVPHGCDHE